VCLNGERTLLSGASGPLTYRSYTAPPASSVVVCLDEMGPESAQSFPGIHLVPTVVARAGGIHSRGPGGHGRRRTMDGVARAMFLKCWVLLSRHRGGVCRRHDVRRNCVGDAPLASTPPDGGQDLHIRYKGDVRSKRVMLALNNAPAPWRRWQQAFRLRAPSPCRSCGRYWRLSYPCGPIRLQECWS
jgi:hypothetical protein